MSSSTRLMRRPLPSPSNGIEVSDGQAMTMFSPSPEEFLMSCRWNPCPKASSRLTAAVPQTTPKMVRKVRSLWLFRSRRSCLRVFPAYIAASIRDPRGPSAAAGDPPRPARASAGRLVGLARASAGDLLGRPLHHLVLLVQAREDLDVQPVGESGVHLDPRRLAVRRLARDLDEGPLAVVLELDQALGDPQHVLLLAEDQVGVGRIAGAQDDAGGGVELDLDLEEARPFLLGRLGG